ncbi:hypothetical protein CC2G_000661 [Coprinopsis cinerea AmutBmut pab1-1]|nr:hypothetical protein CC2G_000661 [Coprinopsis cinerea AmutBmut pab1-1]
MQGHYRSPSITSKFIAIYSKLLQGVPPQQLHQSGEPEQLISDLLDLRVDREYLSSELKPLSKDVYLGRLKPLLNLLFSYCTRVAWKAGYQDVKKIHALETLTAVCESCLSQSLSGWEIMEMLAGSVAHSDRTFNDFTAMLNDVIGDNDAPVETRQQALELGLVFVCSISQLSPGAYFLRRNMFPAIVNFIKTPATEPYTLQAIVFLAILANYHKSDAARLNPYLKRIKECEDELVMLRLCSTVSKSLNVATKAYTDACTTEVSVGNLASTFTNAMSFLRPDRLISTVAQNSAWSNNANGEPGKPQPVVSAVSLLPFYEFVRGNRAFVQTLLQTIDSTSPAKAHNSSPLASLLSFASHLFTHGSSASTDPRTSSYANLALDTLLTLVESEQAVEVFTSKITSGVNLCRQRLPKLPIPPPRRQLACEVLDCCNLWLRHNLHRRLSTQSHLKCIWICHRIVWYLQDRRIRLDYHWKELWVSVLGLLSFLVVKFDALVTTGGVEQLVLDTLSFVASAIACSEVYLPSPQASYELIYELVRNGDTLEKQQDILANLTVSRSPSRNEALAYIYNVAEFYKEKITSKGASRKVSDAMQVVMEELESNGLHIPHERFSGDLEPPIRAEEVLDFARHACGDGLALIAELRGQSS